MIKTKHMTELEIDENKFSITVSEPTKAQRDELSLISKDYQVAIDEIRPLQVQLNELMEEFTINKEILAHAIVIEKLKVVFEQKALYKEILRIQKELKTIDKNYIDFSVTVSNFFSKKFDFMVSGEGKDALKKEMQDKEISYQTIVEVIEDLIAPSKEKK